MLSKNFHTKSSAAPHAYFRADATANNSRVTINDSAAPNAPIGQLLTRSAAAAHLGVQPQTLAVWACTKRYPLPYVKIGRRVMYRLTDLEAFVMANRHGIDSLTGGAHV
jgi:hypothetical protein